MGNLDSGGRGEAESPSSRISRWAALGRGSPLVVVRSLREDETLGWDVWCVGLGPGSGSF